MTLPIHFEELTDLVWALVNDRLDGAAADRLEELLDADVVNRRVYIKLMDQFASLEWEKGNGRNDQREVSYVEAVEAAAISPIPNLFIHPSPAFPSFFGSAMFSYLVAAMIVGAGLLVAWVWKLPTPEQIAVPSPATQRQAPVESEPPMQFVGRITGMVDCRWSDATTAVPGPVAVPVGRKYALASGLMEISYDTGAKVILQGPCTYEVESPAGGFLSIGKLTARLEKKEERRTKNEELSASSSSFLIPHSDFVVRTPSAMVTDLGTEFGVEVGESGETSARVFQGIVEVQPIARDGQHGQAVRLAENETVSVERDSDGQSRVARHTVDDTATFVRVGELPKLAEQLKLKPFRQWRAYSQELRRDPSLIAYYDFQQKPGLPALLPNVAANGDETLDGIVENATWTDGRMPGKHALRFNGVDQHVQITVPHKLDDLTLAAWVYVESLHDLCNGLLMSDRQSTNSLHWQLRADGAVGLGIAGSSVHFYQAVPAFDRQHLSRWRHLAVIYDHRAMRVRLFVDGQITDEVPIETHAPISLGLAWIGHWNSGDFSNPDFVRNLCGKMDEMVIFNRPLESDEIQRMFVEGCVSTAGSRIVTKSVRPHQPQRHDVEKR